MEELLQAGRCDGNAIETCSLSASGILMQVKVSNREVDRFKYLASVLTRDGNCTREIKMRIVIAKEAFNRKTSLLTSKLNM